MSDEGSEGATTDAAGLGRRDLLLASLLTSLGLGALSILSSIVGLLPPTEGGAALAPPAPGDLLVGANGPRLAKTLHASDIAVDAAPQFAWPMDPVSRTVRKQNPRNLVLLVRAGGADWFSPAEAQATALGVAAYSAICTHLCCTVSDWSAGTAGQSPRGTLVCPCHLSHFDPWDGARVVFGPAPRPLPSLPLRADEQQRLAVAAPFSARVGCQA